MDISKSEHTAEQGFLLNIIFKPNETGLRLRPEETQLLLAYIGEILKEIEIEEKLIIQEQQAVNEVNDARKDHGSKWTAEFLVASELSRRGYTVAFTQGRSHTKL